MSGEIKSRSSEIRLPEEETEHENQPSNFPRKAPILTYRQLGTLSVVIIFSITGMVSINEISIVLLSIFYIFFLSKVAFPSHSLVVEPRIFGQKNRILDLYVLFAAIIGLFLPIAYIVEGIYEGDRERIEAAVPHVFLLSVQVFMEGVTYSNPFSIPIRAFVPVFYNSLRVYTNWEWLKSEISKGDEDFGRGGSVSVWKLHIGRGLAVANMVLWCFNLFGFLLPVYLPRALKRHYLQKVKV